MLAADPPARRPRADRFVGRAAELTELDDDLRSAPLPRGPVWLLRGVAGVGKTRLAEELSRRAAESGVTVVWAQSPDELTAPPYWPWTQVVRGLLGRSRGTDLAELALDEPGPVDRFELFDACAAILREATERGRLLVVLDDLHTADHATLQLTRFLARHLSDTPLLLVATARNGAGVDPVVSDHLDALARLGRSMELTGLTLEAVGELLTDRDHASDVHAVTGGNPLHVHQLLHRLHAVRDTAVPGSATELHEALRRSVADRVLALEGAARTVLGCAAVLGSGFDRSELAALAEPLDDAEVDAALVELEAQGFVFAGDPGTFQHRLVADEAYAVLDEADRHRLHHRAATLIGSDPERVGEAARHLLRASPEHREEAVAMSRRAGALAIAAAAHEDAVVHLTRAMDAVDSDTDGPLRLDVLLDLGAALWRAGRTTEADAAYEEAWSQGLALGDADSLARAVLGSGIEYYFADDARPTALARVEAALAAQPPEKSPTRARLLAELATHHLARTAPLGRELAREAVAMARQFADPIALGNALIARQVSDLGPATVQDRIASGHEILTCAREAGDYRLAMHGRFLLMGALLEAGDIGGLDGQLLLHDGATEDLGEPRFDRFSLWLRATRAMLAGDVVAGESLAERTFEISSRLGDPDAVGVYGGQIGVLRWMQGRVLEMEPLYADLRASEPHEPLWPSVLAWLAAVHGRAETARGLLAAVPDPATVPGGMHWLLLATTYAEVSALVGTDAQVDTAWNALVPYADHMVPIAMGAAVWGTVAKPLGRLALRRGQVEQGLDYLRTAMRTCARLGAHPWMIDAQLDLADALAEHRPGDPEIVALRSEAADAAGRLGLDLFLRRLADSAAAPETGPRAAAVRRAEHEPAHAEGRPSVRVIGAFEVIDPLGTPARWTSRKARELLKILVSRRGAPVNRETLMDLLWPDDDPSVLANRLSVALSTVRRALDPGRTLPPGDLISTTFDAVALNLEVVDVDVEHLLEGTREVLGRRLASGDGQPGSAAARAAELLDLHRGEALPDEPHAEWAVPIRGEVHLAITSLARLVAEAAARSGHHLQVVEAHRRILDIDPFDETAHLGLTSAYRAMGAHGQATAAYDAYVRRMAELGVPAAPEPDA